MGPVDGQLSRQLKSFSCSPLCFSQGVSRRGSHSQYHSLAGGPLHQRQHLPLGGPFTQAGISFLPSIDNVKYDGGAIELISRLYRRWDSWVKNEHRQTRSSWPGNLATLSSYRRFNLPFIFGCIFQNCFFFVLLFPVFSFRPPSPIRGPGLRCTLAISECSNFASNKAYS